MPSHKNSSSPPYALPTPELHVKIESLINPETETDRDVRYNAAESLGRAADVRAADALCTALTDPDRGVRSAAAWALERLSVASAAWPLYLDNESTLALCAALNDKDNARQVRIVASRALGHTASLTAVASLCSALNDMDTAIYLAAADSLVNLGDACLLALCEARRDSNPSVQIRADFTIELIRSSTPNLAQRILTSTTLSAVQIVDTIEALRTVPRTHFGVPVNDVPANLQRYCRSLCRQRGLDEALRRGAQAALVELERRANPKELLRPSRRGDGLSQQELLRATSGAAHETEPNQLVRASNGAGSKDQ